MRIHFFIIFLILSFAIQLRGQTRTNINSLNTFINKKQNDFLLMRQQVETFARLNNIPIRRELQDGTIIEMQAVYNNIPYYYKTENINAAITARTDSLWSVAGLSLNLSGYGYSNLGEWDGGAILLTHQEFGSRVTQGDTPSLTSSHSTHVAGTMIAEGIDAAAKGMAYEADLTAYDWNNDKAEMAAEALTGMEISCHSYGFITGWHNDGAWHWFGDINVDQNESFYFGFYDNEAADWDQIAYDAPNYLMVKSAGNDNQDPAPAAGTAHSHNGIGSFTDNHNDDGFDGEGWDLLRSAGVAKNVLTVAAVGDVASYYDESSVIIESYSSRGPTDDGRIKPDISANGASLYSTDNTGNANYTYKSGTSMATPSSAGTMVLLQEHFQSINLGTVLRSATLKGLVIHTASEAGNFDGPDYTFGWGLINALAAAKKINEDTLQNVIDEQSLADGGSYSRSVTASGSEPLKVTIVWTDPAGTPVSDALDPSSAMLVNDLDLRLSRNSVTYYPWQLNVSSPSSAASNETENNIDNVEQVYIAYPVGGGSYTITVDHDGSLNGGTQAFSMIISGIDEYASVPLSCSNNLLVPNHGAIDVSLATTLAWEAVDDAASYDLYFGTDGGGISTPTNIENGTNFGVASYGPALQSNTTYYLQVVPRNNQGPAAGCNTIWSFTTETISIVNSFPFTEDFEGGFAIGTGNDWLNDTDDDDDWTNNSGATGSSGTGPNIDHTVGNTSGTYLYVEASLPNYPNKIFNLLCPAFDFSNLNNPHMEFWYHMYGSLMGDLFIDVYDNGYWNTGTLSITGEQSSDETDWKLATVDLSSFKTGTIQKIRFRGITGENWDSDIAIDDVSIRGEAYRTIIAGSSELHTFANTGISIEFTNPNSGEIIMQASTFNENAGIIGSLPNPVVNISSERYWEINLLNGSVDGTYSITLDLVGISGISVYSTLSLLKRSDNMSSWEIAGSNNYIGSGSLVEWTGVSDGFSQFAIGGEGDNALPIELLSFDGQSTDNGIKLAWQTASEINNLGFIVLRKAEDETFWQEISSYNSDENLKGAGTIATGTDYYFVDNNVEAQTTYFYKIADVDYSGNRQYSFEIKVQSANLQIEIPDKFVLKNAYPNPFNPQITLYYGLPEAARVKIEIYDISANKVLTLINRQMNAGWHRTKWNGRNRFDQQIASGVYFYIFKTGNISETRKIIMIK